ncbi:glycosyltransferase family 2 protein [Idiomarina abyssalis]|nr:glycosyltransferase family 2 protein [Idiomarina abyssalis]
MATYNGAKYIHEQLQSFVDQTRQPDELIITDDCSTDDTESIVREFAKNAPFKVEFHRNEKNLGYCGNFNAALMKTSGDLVFLSDQDDVWFPEKIEYMTKIAESNSDALAVMNDAELTDGELNSVKLTKLGQMKSAGMGPERFVMGCCAVVRRELLDLCLPIPKAFKAHDNWIIAFADGLDAKVVNSKVLQYYRRHESNESQFIANRTSKVTRYHFFKHSIKTLAGSGNEQRYKLMEQKLVINRLNEILSKSSVKRRNQLEIMFREASNKLDHQRLRLNLRKKRLLTRGPLLMKLLVTGHYRYSRGILSFLRDMLG